MNVRWLPPLAAVLCGLLTIECAWSKDHATSSVTAVLPPPGQRCGTVCPNSFSNRTSLSDNSNDRWKRLCLVSRAAAPCVWMLRALTTNLLTYLLIQVYVCVCVNRTSLKETGFVHRVDPSSLRCQRTSSNVLSTSMTSVQSLLTAV